MNLRKETLMPITKIDPTISSYSYFHHLGNKNNEISISIFKTADGERTATEQLLLEMYCNQVEKTQKFNKWLLEFVKENGIFDQQPKPFVLDMIKMIGVDDETYIYDLYTQLDMSKSEDVAQYFKLINIKTPNQTLFEMLDTSIVSLNKKPIIFKNPSDTKRFKFANGTYPMNPANNGGTYIIHLFAAPKDSNHFSEIKAFTNNDDLYNYIAQNDLTFE